MKTIQRLNDYDSLSRFSITNISEVSISQAELSSWTMSGGSLLFTGNDYYVSSHYVMEASPSVSLPVTLSLNVNYVFETDDNNEDFVFSCVAFCAQKSITIEAKLYDEIGDEVDGVTKTIQAGTWSPIRSNVFTKVPASGTRQYKVVLTISGHETNTIRISTTNLVNDSAWASNPIIQSIRPYIPGFYETYDRKEENPQYPFFRFIDVLTDTIADTMFLYSEWFQYDAAEIIPGFSKDELSTRSRLTNYKAVYDENIDWLAQFSGNKLKKQIYIDNTGIITDTAGFKQSQLYPAIYGRGAGTQGSIKEAIGYVLTGAKTVVIGQHAGGDPWVIRVITLVNETPGLDVRTDVHLATTANIALSGTGLSVGSIVDGEELVAGDRVLVKNQDIASENGVYVVPVSGLPSRASDFDSSLEVETGATFIVDKGDTNGGKAFELTTTGTITVGSTALSFGVFSGSPEVLKVVEAARPLGYKIIHEIVREFTLTLGDLEFGILGTATL